MNAERSVIGSLLLDGEVINNISFLQPEMFTNDFLGKIYLEYLRANDRMTKLSLMELVKRVSNDSLPEPIVAQAIREIMNETITSATVVNDAKLVKQEYKKKQAEDIVNRTVFTDLDIESDVAKMISELEAVIEQRENTPKSLKEIAKDNYSNYFIERETGKIMTGIESIDEKVLWLENGDTTVIAARPAVGKSALSLQIAHNIASNGFRVALYNLEMKESQVFERFVSRESKIALTRIKKATNFLNDEESQYKQAVENISKLDIDIVTGSKKVSQIKSECKNMKYDVIIIDYLQLVRADGNFQSRQNEVGYVSRTLKAIAMELGVHIIVLSQLNRSSEYAQTKEPDMADLRDSGEIEQDASNIVLLWNLDEERKYKGCKVDKARQGRTGKDALIFNGSTMDFEKSDKTIHEITSGLPDGFQKTKKKWSDVG